MTTHWRSQSESQSVSQSDGNWNRLKQAAEYSCNLYEKGVSSVFIKKYGRTTTIIVAGSMEREPSTAQPLDGLGLSIRVVVTAMSRAMSQKRIIHKNKNTHCFSVDK